MAKRLLNNWSLKLISLVLAFLLWFLVVQIGDPKDDRDMGEIQVKLVNTELLTQENKVYEVLDDTDSVRVTVYAPKSVFTQLRSTDIIAEADVSKLTDINTVPIVLSSANANVVAIKGNHDSVKLNVEEKASKYISLMSNTVGTVADGYVVSNITPDQNRIEVSGPKSAVEQVKYAAADIDVTDASSNLTVNVGIKLYDAEGNVIVGKNIRRNTDYIKVAVEILAVREVPVNFTVAGEPKEGFILTGENICEPASVRIAGTARALSAVDEIVIPESETDVTGESESVEKTIDIREYIPDNIKLADSGFGGKVKVTVGIAAIAGKTMQIPVSDISVTNVPQGFTAEITDSPDEIYSVSFKGLQEQIALLKSGEVRGVVDIKSWMNDKNMTELRAGNFSIPVTFSAGSSVKEEEKLYLKIVIKEEN